MLSQGIKAGNCFLTLTKVRILSLIAGKNTLATHCSIVFYVISILQDRFKKGLKSGSVMAEKSKGSPTIRADGTDFYCDLV